MRKSLKMGRFKLHCLFILVFIISAIDGQRRTGNSKEPSKNVKNSSYANNEAKQGTDTPSKLQQKQSKGRGGIGAWGIIAVTLTLILSGLSVYYFVTFYPIVCKKERMYDVMEMTTV